MQMHRIAKNSASHVISCFGRVENAKTRNMVDGAWNRLNWRDNIVKCSEISRQRLIFHLITFIVGVQPFWLLATKCRVLGRFLDDVRLLLNVEYCVGSASASAICR